MVSAPPNISKIRRFGSAVKHTFHRVRDTILRTLRRSPPHCPVTTGTTANVSKDTPSVKRNRSQESIFSAPSQHSSVPSGTNTANKVNEMASSDPELNPSEIPRKAWGVAWKALETALRHLEKSADGTPHIKSVVDELATCLSLTQVVTEDRQEYDKLATELTITANTLSSHITKVDAENVSGSIAHTMESIKAELTHIRQKQDRQKIQQTVGVNQDQGDAIQQYRQIESLFRQLQIDISLQTSQDATKPLETKLPRDMFSVDDARYLKSSSMTINRRECTAEMLATCDAICWTNESSTTAHLFSVWPKLKSLFNEADLHSRSIPKLPPRKPNISFSPAHRHIRPKLVTPLRLFDCENECVKDRETYLREANGLAEYLIVSQVWGNPQYLLPMPSVEWDVPITSQAKWDAILGYCRQEDVKWMWMDILCINQANSVEAEQEKMTEIPKMGLYYKGAAECLAVPEDYVNFPMTYRKLMDFYSGIKSSLKKKWRPEQSGDKNIAWENIALLDAIMKDQWFWRIWTYQELLLPRRLTLPDGQGFDMRDLKSLAKWYQEQLQSGTLAQPAGAREYDFINSDAEIVVSKNWLPQDWSDGWDPRSGRRLGWSAEQDLQHKGYVDLISLVVQTRHRQCKVQRDRLLGLYGLLNDAEIVPIPDPAASLEVIWKDIIRKVVLSGKVWPLLHDMMNLDEQAVEGERWMPEITALNRRADPIDVHPETLNHHNSGNIAITPAGLQISVRVVGQVIGTSVSLGDDVDEINKLLACIWILKAKGLNTSPIVKQLMDGLEVTGGSQKIMAQVALDLAFSKPSLTECFDALDAIDIGRVLVIHIARKLAIAPGVGGCDRTVLVVHIEGQDIPMVCLAWIHRSIPPATNNCWVWDVTSDPVSKVERWVIANQVGNNVFRKIGTVSCFPSLLEGSSIRTQDLIFC